jgi:hypothetical protein
LLVRREFENHIDDVVLFVDVIDVIGGMFEAFERVPLDVAIVEYMQVHDVCSPLIG